MTPERIQELKGRYEGLSPTDITFMTVGELTSVLAALEEAQQQRDDLSEIIERAVIPCHVCGEHGCECNVTLLSDFATGEMVVNYHQQLAEDNRP